jgi:hypothetical protein
MQSYEIIEDISKFLKKTTYKLLPIYLVLTQMRINKILMNTSHPSFQKWCQKQY